MSIHHYRVDPNVLVQAITAESVLLPYMQTLEEERSSIVDRELVGHLGRLQRVLARVMTAGLEVAAADDQEGADCLLTDILAVATWNGWHLPVEELDASGYGVPEGRPTGFLGTGATGSGASVWVEGDHVVLARNRNASTEADEAHWEDRAH